MMTFTRKRQTFLLIILTAATLMPSYSLQGWLAGGHSASDLPFWFWVWETVAWSARALIEAGAILFLFETNAKTHTQERGLLFFKIALIVLITLTLGVVVGAAGLGQSIADALPRPLYWLWSFAVASYAPLMLGSVGMAYRIQPHDTSDMTQEPEPIASKVVVSPRPMTQRKKEIVSSEPVASKSVDALPEPVASPKLVASKSVDALPEPVASPKLVASKPDDALPQVVASSEPDDATDESVDPRIVIPQLLRQVLRVDETQEMERKAKLWDGLTLEEQFAAYQAKKTLGLSDDKAAAELGVSRSTINRMKKDYYIKYPIVTTNGFHKEQ